MSLFIGSAPRLAERRPLRYRIPSRYYAHDALLAPNSSPGVGRFSFWGIHENASVTPPACRDKSPRRRLLGRTNLNEALIDPAQVRRRLQQPLGQLLAKMLSQRGIFQHLVMHGRACELEAEHAVAR